MKAHEHMQVERTNGNACDVRHALRVRLPHFPELLLRDNRRAATTDRENSHRTPHRMYSLLNEASIVTVRKMYAPGLGEKCCAREGGGAVFGAYFCAVVFEGSCCSGRRLCHAACTRLTSRRSCAAEARSPTCRSPRDTRWTALAMLNVNATSSASPRARLAST